MLFLKDKLKKCLNKEIEGLIIYLKKYIKYECINARYQWHFLRKIFKQTFFPLLPSKAFQFN